jgi:protein-tyrosine phosphatase
MTNYCRSHCGVHEVPDPYYGGPQGFEQVLDLLEDACTGLLEALRPRS